MCLRPFLEQSGTWTAWEQEGRKTVSRAEGHSSLSSGLSGGNREKKTDGKCLPWESRMVPMVLPGTEDGQ